MRMSFTKKICDMFTWLAILCCHSVCGGEKTKSACKSHAGKKRPKNVKDRVTERCMGRLFEKRDWCNSQSFQGRCPWTPQGNMWAYSSPYESPVVMANVLTHTGLWPAAIKLNLSWKTEVSKSAWIKPCSPLFISVMKIQENGKKRTI